MKTALGDLPGILEECIEKFWADNLILQRSILRDWYNGGRISTETNMAGLRAVDRWLKQESRDHA